MSKPTKNEKTQFIDFKAITKKSEFPSRDLQDFLEKQILPVSGEWFGGRLWLHYKAGTLTMGLTNLALDELGSIQHLELPAEGDEFEADDALFSVEGSSDSLEFPSPVTGVVTQINDGVTDEPELIHEDPIEAGWLLKIEVGAN